MNKEYLTILVSLIGLIIAHFSRPLFAEVYKWEDADHNINYSETPPNNVDATPMSPPPPPSSSAEQERAALQKLNDNFNKNTEAAINAQKNAAMKNNEAKIRKTNCERAQIHLKNMLYHPRERLTDAQGDTRQLTNEERDKDIEDTKKAIQEFCSEAPVNK
jgi:hypothetical protein